MTSAIHFPAYIIGLMSGTSADGVDAALIYTDGRQLVQTHESVFVPYPDALRADILGLMRGVGKADAIANALTLVHIEAVDRLRLMSQIAAQDIKLIGFHGQTIRHAPQEGITVQIGDPALMAARLRIPVVADFRSADVRAGGQGAPLVPLYHAALASTLAKPVMVVNIGGVANVTWIGQSPVVSLQSSVVSRQSSVKIAGDWRPETGDSLLAFDCGPGNALIDDWVHRHTGARYDKGGELAAKGTVDEVVLWQLLADEFFARPVPKSLDRNHFDKILSAVIPLLSPVIPADAGIRLGEPAKQMDPVMRRGDTFGNAEPWNAENGAATLTAFTAAAIAKACEHVPAKPKHLLITGGGRHNPTLMHLIKTYAHCHVDAVEHVGWDGDMLEAQAFAYLAARSVQGLPLSLPSTTGVSQPVTGGVFYPSESAGGS